MKITIIALGSRSAGPVYSFQMAQALSKIEGLELQIIISKEVDNLKSWEDWFVNRSNVSYHKIETYKHNTLSLLASFFNHKKIGNLISLIKQFQPGIVYCPFGLMWSSFVFPFLKNTKIITTVHDPRPYTHGYKLSQFILANIGILGEKYVNGRIVLNKKDAAFVANKYNCKVQVIPHAAYDFYVPDGYEIKYKINRKIAFIGRIDVYKGIDLLVKAFAEVKIKDLELIIAGAGNINKDTLDLIESNSKIHLQNRYIANEEIPAIMDSVDFIVLPYTNATQSGVIPLAFAFGKTVIATNVGSLSEQVPNGTGIIVNPEVKDIAQAIDNMYANEKDLVLLSKNAKEFAEKELSWDHSARLLVSFAKTLL